MNIIVNEKTRDIPDGATIETLLKVLEISPEGIAVELNRQIVPLTRHNVTFLKADDTVEIVRMVGGG